MVEKKYAVVWTKTFATTYEKSIRLYQQGFTSNAVKVLEDIVNATHKAVSNPEFYGPDKYKQNNDGSYQAFEKHHYRIAYRFDNNDIRVLRVRHTSMEPKDY